MPYLDHLSTPAVRIKYESPFCASEWLHGFSGAEVRRRMVRRNAERPHTGLLSRMPRRVRFLDKESGAATMSQEPNRARKTRNPG